MSDEDEDRATEDALSLGIGRVARTHVSLDYALRHAHSTLTSPGLGVYLQGGLSTDRLVEDCKVMVRAARLDDTSFTSAAVFALGAAKAANETRNRVVHDMWMREIDHPPETPRWNVYRAKRGQLGVRGDSAKDLSDIESAQTELLRATIRIHALGWGLYEVLPNFKDSARPLIGQPGEWVAVMTDRFTINADGGYTVTPKRRA